MTVPNRSYSSPSYRYGFQGQEKDDEIKGEGNFINYKYRMHDPRIGRFFATDPLESTYPRNSPYAFSENDVIAHVELEGLEKDSYYDALFNIEQKSKIRVNGHKDPIRDTNRYADDMIRLYEEGHKILGKEVTQGDLGTYYKEMIYFHAYFHKFGGYSDAEDVSVLTRGRTIDGHEAGILDYSLAGVGVFVPFLSGGVVKKLFKSSVDELAEKVIKLDDGNVLNLSTKGNKFDGNINLSSDSGVIFDADFNISADGKTLTMDNIGFYQHKNGDILGAEGKNKLGKLPFEVLGKIKEQAKSEGFDKLTIKYKRALYDDAGNFTGFGKDVVKDIPLNK